MRRIGVIGVPPPEERRWKIDRNSRCQLEPRMSKLRLVTELPGHPLRGRPHRGEHDRKDDDDLPPENLGRGHDGPRVKRRLPQEQVPYRVGRTNGDCRLRFGRTHAACRRWSVIGGSSENIYDSGAFRLLTHTCHLQFKTDWSISYDYDTPNPNAVAAWPAP